MAWRLETATITGSFVALLFSGISLYETVLKQPHLAVLAARNWQYARGPGTRDEAFLVPVTIVNRGARDGAVLRLTLALSGPDGRRKVFASTFRRNPESSVRELFAPISIAGRSSYTATFIFTPQDTGRPVVEAAGRFTAALTLHTAYDRSYGVLDDLVHSAPEVEVRSLTLETFEIAPLLAGRKAHVIAQPFAD